MKLNIGAGYKHIEGYESIDIRPETKPKHITDLEDPNSLHNIDDNSVDEVFMFHVFEHIKNVQSLMKEIYRVCKHKAIIKIECPYYMHRTAVEDPTHVRFMTENSMMYFDKRTTGSDGKPFVKDYDFHLVKVVIIPDTQFTSLANSSEELQKKAQTHWNVIETINYELEVCKNG